ncbi:MAG: DUF3105 domain-containing protein [Anaerolineales bacterium]|nr:DUF3105 domain-containing protein [Anaerolineales bacterium]
MSKQSIKDRRRARQRSKTVKTILVFGGASLGLLLVIGILIWPAVRPAAGEALPEMSPDHVEEGADPGPYNSDPPTSGRHYADSLQAGFYNVDDLEIIGPYPEGYLVHNLEHGYVIFWYNCERLDRTSCEELKIQIQAVMEDVDNHKVIAFPRDTIETPLVLTSWGRLQQFDDFDESAIERFVRTNRNRAPEPHAD